jgi:hypothetical protein
MNASVLVRELEDHERSTAEGNKTGDLLPDGSVLLRTTDMQRMGLRGLREWLFDASFRNHLVIALLTDKKLPWLRDTVDDDIELESAAHWAHAR